MLYFAVILPFIVNFLPIKNKHLKIALSVMPALFIILFRWGLGTDYFSYEYIYFNQPTDSLARAIKSNVSSMEVGFKTLIYVFRNLNIHYQVFVSSMSLVIYAFFIKWLGDLEVNTPLAIMLLNGMFFVVWVLSGLRQGLVLAIGSYLFLNKKDILNVWQSLIAILILSLFHMSAVFYILILLVKKIDFTRKQLTILLALSLLTTLLPIQYLLLPFESISIVSKLMHYTSSNIGFWDFSGLIRLLFASFILIFYNVFKENKLMNTYANISLIGFTTYFILKFSEVSAGRLNIFTLVLMIPLFLYFVNSLKSYRSLYLIAISGLFLFSMVYLQKDLRGHQMEVGKSSIDQIYKLRLFNEVDYQDYFDYDNYSSFLTYQKGYCEILKKVTLSSAESEVDGYAVVRDSDSRLYGVIDSRGQWQISPIYDSKPQLYKDILYFEEDSRYFNLDNKEVFEVEDLVKKYQAQADLIENQDVDSMFVDKEFHFNTFDDFFQSTKNIKQLAWDTYNQPFKYQVLKVNYFYRDFYFLMNHGHLLQPRMLFTKPPLFDINNMARGSTLCGGVIINSNGEIVWIENN